FGSRQVNPAADLDEATLQKIAQTTGGQYFRARDPADLAGIYQLLDQLEPVEQEPVSYRPRQALGYVPLLLALLLSFALALRPLLRSASWRGSGAPQEAR
ncbi:MAG: BatB protein, partial [Halioglobus sp.]